MRTIKETNFHVPFVSITVVVLNRMVQRRRGVEGSWRLFDVNFIGSCTNPTSVFVLRILRLRSEAEGCSNDVFMEDVVFKIKGGSSWSFLRPRNPGRKDRDHPCVL